MDNLACRVERGDEGLSLSNHLSPPPSKGLSSIAQALGERGRQGQTAPGCAAEAQAQGRRQDGGRGLWERKRGFPGGGGAEAAERGSGGGGRGAWQPPPGSFPEAVRVGQLSGGTARGGSRAQLASSGNQRAQGRALEKTMGLCVCRGVCVYTEGRREEGGEKEEGAAQQLVQEHM